jgi:isopenicillin-N epimerase
MTDCPSAVFPPIHRDAWPLDPNVDFLNHGSFGACPRPVLERQQELRLEMEREPVDFLVRKTPKLLDDSRNTLAELIGADAADLVFVPNATDGVNAVLRSLVFRPGDEILVTTHDYNACRNAARYVAERSGANVVVAEVPTPITAPEQVVDAVLAGVTDRTRLAMLDHITSPTAIVFPIVELVEALRARGIDALVDGAHGAGMVPLDMQGIGAAYYTGNCHKWLCTPKGSGFLYVRRDRQDSIQPTTISHGWNRSRPGYSPFQDVFDWPGTIDPTPWLCVGDAIRFLSGLMPGGLPALQRRNHELVMAARDVLCRRLDATTICADSMLGSTAAVVMPQRIASHYLRNQPPDVLDHMPLYEDMLRLGFEAPAYCWPNASQLIVRVSAQAYNDLTQYERLAETLSSLP